MNQPIHSSGPGALCVHICSPGTDQTKMFAALCEVGLRPDQTMDGGFAWHHDITDAQWDIVDKAERLAGGIPPGEYLEIPL